MPTRLRQVDRKTGINALPVMGTEPGEPPSVVLNRWLPLHKKKEETNRGEAQTENGKVEEIAKTAARAQVTRQIGQNPRTPPPLGCLADASPHEQRAQA